MCYAAVLTKQIHLPQLHTNVYTVKPHYIYTNTTITNYQLLQSKRSLVCLCFILMGVLLLNHRKKARFHALPTITLPSDLICSPNFVHGHEKNNNKEHLNWRKLPTIQTTLQQWRAAVPSLAPTRDEPT